MDRSVRLPVSPMVLQVALKRIPDVVRNLENARKVLREVCIQRRVAHPNVVALHDVFWRPAATGARRCTSCNASRAHPDQARAGCHVLELQRGRRTARRVL